MKVKILSVKENNSQSLPKQIDVGFVKELKASCSNNMSEKSVRTFIANFRRKFGKNSVEPGIIEKIREATHTLDEYFEVSSIEINNGTESKTLVFCNKLNQFLAFVLDYRSYEDVVIKIGIDGGAGSLKVCMSVQNPSAPVIGFKDTGVNKIFILAIAFGVDESYENVEIMFNKIDIQNLISCIYQNNIVIVGDLKIINIILGKKNIIFPARLFDSKISYLKCVNLLLTL